MRVSCFSGLTKKSKIAPTDNGPIRTKTDKLMPKLAITRPNKNGEKMPENFPKIEKNPKNSLAFSIGSIFAK